MNQPKEWRYTWLYMVKEDDTIIHLGTGYTTLPAPPTDRNLKSLSDAAATNLKRNELRDMPGHLILTITGAIPVYGPEHDTRIDLVPAKTNLADQFFSGVR